MRTLFVLTLFACLTGTVCAQATDLAYRRGVQVSVGAYYEELFPLLYATYVRASEGEEIRQYPQRIEGVRLNGGPPANFYTRQDLVYGTRTDYTRRLQWQIGIHKKRLGGLEWGAGLALSLGTYDTSNETFAPSDQDNYYVASRVSYRRVGLIGNLGYCLLNNRRLQPYLGLQTEASHASMRGSDFSLRSQQGTVSADLPDFRGEQTQVFDFRLRLLLSLRYALTERVMICADGKFFPDFDRVYAGVAGRYRLTDY